MIHTKVNRSQKNKVIFSTGVLLFLIGFIGMVYSFWINPYDSSSELLPAETVIFAEFKTDKNSIDKMSELDVATIIYKKIEENIPSANISAEKLSSWIGSKMSLSWLKNGDFIVSAKFRNKSKVKNYIKETFLLPGEELSERNINGIKVYSPSFSSQLDFVLKNGWLIITTSKDATLLVLNSKDKLAHLEKYQKIRRDLPYRKNNIYSYINLEVLAASDSNLLSSRQPLVKSFTRAIPALGAAIEIEDQKINLKSKLLTSDGIFSREILENTPNEVIPELANYAPQDSLFFINGYDLNSKYNHTKSFLEEFHPQLALIFDGILRSEFKKIFGDNFDFQKDLLDLVKGQYAIIFNFTDEKESYPYFSLITSFGDGTTEQNSEKLKKIIKKAQQNYSTKIVDHYLPDGTTRKELVITDIEEINIENKSESSFSYFTAENEDKESESLQKFSYGFLNQFLVFSNQEKGIKDIFSTYKNKSNLTNNEDFRESILFDFSASESYGYLNSNKLSNVIEKASEENENLIPSVLKKFRNISFSRKTFPQEVFFSATLKKR